MFECINCKTHKPSAQFKKSKTAKRGHRAVCKECDSISNKQWIEQNKERKAQKDIEWKEKNKGKVLNTYHKYNLKRDFGITLEQYNEMLESQENCCGICGIDKCKTGKRFAVDHCHNTGKIRGLLCQACNTGIGKLQENVTILEKAIKYIKQQGLQIKK